MAHALHARQAGRWMKDARQQAKNMLHWRYYYHHYYLFSFVILESKLTVQANRQALYAGSYSRAWGTVQRLVRFYIAVYLLYYYFNLTEVLPHYFLPQSKDLKVSTYLKYLGNHTCFTLRSVPINWRSPEYQFGFPHSLKVLRNSTLNFPLK